METVLSTLSNTIPANKVGQPPDVEPLLVAQREPAARPSAIEAVLNRRCPSCCTCSAVSVCLFAFVVADLALAYAMASLSPIETQDVRGWFDHAQKVRSTTQEVTALFEITLVGHLLGASSAWAGHVSEAWDVFRTTQLFPGLAVPILLVVACCCCCCCYRFTARASKVDRAPLHPFFLRSRKPGKPSEHEWQPIATIRKALEGLPREEQVVHVVNATFVPILTALYYYELYQNFHVCIEAKAAGEFHLIFWTVVFQFLPIVHIACFVRAHVEPLRDAFGIDIFWTIVQEFTLSGPLISLVQLLRDGEMPVEFIDSASFAGQMLYSIIPQSATQLIAISRTDSPALREGLEIALYTNLVMAALEMWKSYFHWGPPLNLQKYRYAKHTEHWWLLPLLLAQAVARTGVFVLGPALVATLVLPATAVIIVVAGLLFASIDIWGATIFPHMWDQRTGQSYACTPYGWLTFFLAVPSALVVDGSFQFGAAGNQSLLRCGLDFLLLPLWTITTCVSALLYEYLGIGGAEIELLYTRLEQLLRLYACSVAVCIIVMALLRCKLAQGRQEAIGKATAFQTMFHQKREAVRAAHAALLC